MRKRVSFKYNHRPRLFTADIFVDRLGRNLSCAHGFNNRRRTRRRVAAAINAFDGGLAVFIYGDFAAPERCPIVSLNLGDWDSAAVSDQLSQRFGVATRAGLHCAPLAHRALGTWKQGAVRFSFSHCNTEAEIDQGLAALRTLATE